MMSLLVLLTVLWFSRRVLWWIAIRAIVFAIGVRFGWKLLDRA